MTSTQLSSIRSKAFFDMYSQELNQHLEISDLNIVDLKNKRTALLFILKALREKIEQNTGCIALQKSYEKILVVINYKISSSKTPYTYEKII